MNPTNQFFINGDSTLNTESLDEQIQRLNALKQRMQGFNNPQQSNSIWNTIDREITALDESQKAKLMNNEDYIEINNQLQVMIQSELLNIVIPRIESLDNGKDVLHKMLNVVKVTKDKIIRDSNIEKELFSKFREASKNNPELTYTEFLKSIKHD